MPDFIITTTGVVGVDQICKVIVDERLHVGSIHLKDGTVRETNGFATLEALYATNPTILEGNPSIKWKKRAWLIHNLIGHPMMQLCALVGLYKTAMWWHDSTVPKPIGYKEGRRMSG